ncbi:hypothetical protein TOPH_05277 [Tolypocladium ophioglossoides CBS 100239]|uniref:EKC/KEOPS complex subunit BUD32 n=1 Tax=Tolypocladium ophioglossoides (strain CBS 100239) TaxID=1163406 RepID=A0A0L0N8F7_TOLOC|nr:hypothetical protein TOPH_05277 [Tolypocladium ophioglossoides CBS 100239]
MILSEDQIKIIAENPLDEGLQDVRIKLRDCADAPPEGVVISLLGALVTSSAAFNLSAPDGSGNVAEKLFAIQQNVRRGSLKLEQFMPLVVVANSPDTEVWAAVIDFIEAVKPSTPPASGIIPTFFGTPVKTSSSRLDDSEKRDIIEHELFRELRDCTHRGVLGFFEKHFDSAIWDERQKHMLDLLLANHEGAKWKDFPTDPWEKAVWEWLVALEKNALAGAPYTLHTTKTATEFKERKGQMDIFFRKPKSGNRQSTYKDVLVVSEHKRSAIASDFKACLLQLTRHVRSVFADQPMRRFVHAFTIKGTTMELWIFDRSGPYSSGEFDIHREPKKFARALVAYATMGDDAMGLDLSIEWKKGHRYFTAEDVKGNNKQVELNTLLVRQRAVVCRGTTCFSTRQGVAKFSWRSSKRPSEVRHLKLAQEKGVEGVATLVAYREITSIDDLRGGMKFSSGTRHNFRATVHERSDSYSRIQGSDTSESKRKRKSSLEEVSRSTRRRSNSQKSALGHARRSNDRARPSLYTQNREDLCENRILSCLVIAPTGRVVSDFGSIRELLEALRDAIRGHQSLYLKAGILHRDISSNNIIITNPENSGGFKGMLIDLDLAKERDSGPSGARQRTGTMEFMAIEVLRGTDHTYRHDLESFFYVLLWMCARCAWRSFRGSDETEPSESILRKWEIGSFKDIADAKEGHMTVNMLERIMGEFPEVFEVVKPLCLNIRRLLFPFDKDERMMIGTPTGDPERLYSAILAAYDEAIDQL